MIICNNCLGALISRGECTRHSNVTIERLKELDFSYIEEDDTDTWVRCEWCCEGELIENMNEV